MCATRYERGRFLSRQSAGAYDAAMKAAPALLVGLCVMVAPAVHAGRVLYEPPGLSKTARSAPKPVVTNAVKEYGLEDTCTDTALQSKELAGVQCRLAVAAYVQAHKPMAANTDVEAQITLAKDAAAAARSIAEYEPLSSKTGLSTARFYAHRQACRAMLGAYDVLSALPASSTPKMNERAQTALAVFNARGASMKDAACQCVQETLSLAMGAEVTQDEQGALQGVLTSRACFLDESKIRGSRSGPSTTLSPQSDMRAGFIATGTTTGRLLDYAAARSLDLDRCREKFVNLNRIKDGPKLEKCVCGEIARWQFPARKGEPATKIEVPVLEDKLTAAAEVDATGHTTSCGPLGGVLAPKAPPAPAASATPDAVAPKALKPASPSTP